LEAKITIEYDDCKTAKAIADAVSPDNYKTPTGLTIKTVREKNCVITEVEANRKFTTFIATIDDLLFSVSTAEKALRKIKKPLPKEF
jgi:tRNA threonylcarbamoyladenosine modification (KEOPS) complex  Pcc1 subunit